MQRKIFSIRDNKGEVYNQPFMALTHGEAERSFKTLVNDPKSTISQYPEDFDLYYIGEFDDNLGAYTTPQTPQHLVKAISLINKQTTPINAM